MARSSTSPAIHQIPVDLIRQAAQGRAVEILERVASIPRDALTGNYAPPFFSPFSRGTESQ